MKNDNSEITEKRQVRLRESVSVMLSVWLLLLCISLQEFIRFLELCLVKLSRLYSAGMCRFCYEHSSVRATLIIGNLS